MLKKPEQELLAQSRFWLLFDYLRKDICISICVNGPSVRDGKCKQPRNISFRMLFNPDKNTMTVTDTPIHIFAPT